jgi:hypothetical protein
MTTFWCACLELGKQPDALARAGGEACDGGGDYAGLQRGPAVGGGVAAQRDDCGADLGWGDCAVEGLGIDGVAAVDGEMVELVGAVELGWAGRGAA